MDIYYIGGSPCSGKSMAAQLLAGEYNLLYFPVDEFLGKYAAMGKKRGFTACSRQWKGTPDEIWLRDVREQCEQELQFYREIFGFIQDDLQAILCGALKVDEEDFCSLEKKSDFLLEIKELRRFRKHGILIEGAALLPELMHVHGIAPDHYLCITPTREFQMVHYRQRPWVSMILEGCTEKEKAFENWMERDALFADIVRQQCEKYGYASWITDGSRSVSEMLQSVKKRFT